MIDPSPFVVSGGLHHERIALPMPHRISPPSRLVGIFEHLARVGPDGADAFAPAEMLNDPVGKHEELDGMWKDQGARPSHGVSVLIRVCSVSGRNSSPSAYIFLRVRGRI